MHFLKRVLLIWHGQDNDRFTKRRRIPCVKGGVPLAILLTKSHHHHIRIFNAFTGANGVHHRAFVVMPVFVVFRAQNRHAAIVRSCVIGHRAVEGHIQIGGACDDLLAPIGVNFAGQVDV
eukprot:CAMPEP_0184438968 /NCGR_PEP_ID=MMETSP0738-20130409/685977_1 /TAXON_ID=385413 /ORGANISM="Thalassiosira miniscula, Strain CCMP1093" /LENGTH=119 /DNA_ID=CAMNT_0026806487 /DNA_START=668 /DNA_END=1027 /DNA_ORIENTATION=-